MTYLRGLRTPLLVLLHDRDDPLIPSASLGASGARYTEFNVFKHLGPTKGHPSPMALAREVVGFARAVYPLFEQAAAYEQQHCPT